jgi:Helix-turn-helix
MAQARIRSCCEEVAIPFTLPTDHTSHLQLGLVLKLVRQHRHLTGIEVARRLRISHSSYNDWEHGHTRLTIHHLLEFARVTDSDAMAIAISVPFNDPAFAVNCADNKLVTIVVTALHNMSVERGDDMALLSMECVIASIQKICAEFVDHLDRQERFGAAWLAEYYPGSGTQPGKDERPGRSEMQRPLNKWDT